MNNKIFILLLCALAFLAYFNSLSNNFVFDDSVLVANNPQIKSARSLPLIFKSNLYDYYAERKAIFPFNNVYRPLQPLSYFIDYKIWGLKPFGFRIDNIFLHIFNSLLIYLLFSLLFEDSLARGVSFLFAVHPLAVSSVSYISGRADLLAFFFILTSLILLIKFIRSQKKFYYIFSLISAVLALLSRESALLLPLFILLVLSNHKVKFWKSWYFSPYVLLVLFYLVLRTVIFREYALTMHSAFLTPLGRLINFLNIIPRYLALILLPLNLHLFRTTPFISGLAGAKIFFVAAINLLFLYLLIKFRKDKLLFFSASWFLIGLLPAIATLDAYPAFSQAMMAESWVYLSSAGALAIFVGAGGKIFKGLNKFLLIPLILFYVFLTWVNNSHWKNNITLYRDILKYNPAAASVRNNLINEYLQGGLYDEAFTEIKKFAAYCPECSQRYLLEGNYYYLTNQIPQAINSYDNARVINKDNFLIYYNLSLCYGKLKQADKAIGFALESWRRNPYSTGALIQLGDLYSEKKDYRQARIYYQKALGLDPGNKIAQEGIRNAE